MYGLVFLGCKQFEQFLGNLTEREFVRRIGDGTTIRGLKKTRLSRVRTGTAQGSWEVGQSDSLIYMLLVTGNISERCFFLPINSRFKVQMSRWPGINDTCPKGGQCTLTDSLTKTTNKRKCRCL